MKRISYVAALAASAVVVTLLSACSSKSSGGGKSGSSSVALLSNAGVTQTCQTCLSGASGNDCSAQAKTCASDSNCAALDACVNKCTNLNAGCVANCSDAASVNAGEEWQSWLSCACNDCTQQCSECSGVASGGIEGSSGGTVSASGGGSGGGSGSGSGGGTTSSGAGTVTCVIDDSGDYFSCQGDQDGYYCTGSDSPDGDGLASDCSTPSADSSGEGTDYCCE